jgi:hypothetical protein
MPNDVKEVRTALARAIAQRKVPADIVEEVASQLATIKQPIRGIDVCERGICIDFLIEGKNWRRTLSDIVEVEGGRLRGIEIFPWGIINPDILHIRVMQEFDQMPEIRR